MKFLIVTLFIAAAYAVENLDKDAVILKSSFDETADGYKASYETSNGINSQDSGSLKTVGDKKVIVEQGSYRYIDNEGVEHSLKFEADETGFHPVSADLPVAPEPVAIPEYIVRSLEWAATHPYKEEPVKA